jgi:hypothetical protein
MTYRGIQAGNGCKGSDCKLSQDSSQLQHSAGMAELLDAADSPKHPVYKVIWLPAIIKPCILGVCCPCLY